MNKDFIPYYILTKLFSLKANKKVLFILFNECKLTTRMTTFIKAKLKKSDGQMKLTKIECLQKY